EARRAIAHRPDSLRWKEARADRIAGTGEKRHPCRLILDQSFASQASPEEAPRSHPACPRTTDTRECVAPVRKIMASQSSAERTALTIAKLMPSGTCWPKELSDRLRSKAPPALWASGTVEIFETRKVGLFCSVRCSGDAILGAYDSARKFRDDGVTAVSGFHSPVEKECLRILLRGRQPVIICLARAFGKIRLPSDWRRALESGRLLLLSPFEKHPLRPDKNSTAYRNDCVAALWRSPRYSCNPWRRNRTDCGVGRALENS